VKKGEIYPVQRTLTSGPITGSILLGLCMGSGVAISMQYGSGEYDKKMRQSVFQSFAFIAGMALADAIGIGYYLVKHRKETL
jgi:Na+-driven multidrug efflux pump